MQEIPVSKFKATCLAVIEQVRRTGEPVCITRFGQPMAELVPPGRAQSTSWLGALRGSMEIHGDGDIVAPVLDEDDLGELLS